MAGNSGEQLVAIINLTVTYTRQDSPGILAVDRISLELNPGEIVGVLGESGSGKSTLVSSILRLLPRDASYESGQIRFRGRNLLTLSEPEMRCVRGKEISMISQDPALSLNPVIRVGDQIEEVFRAHTGMNRPERKKQVEDLLSAVRFDQPRQIGSAYPHELSGGQRQRMAIAQAIACRPALLIADEPTSKLDATLQSEILALLADIRRKDGTTLLVISHDPTIFAGFADRVLVMYAGRIVEEGKTEDIFRRPMHPYTQALVKLSQRHLMKDMGRRVRFPMIAGESPSPSRRAAGCRFEPRCPERMPGCAASDPKEVFSESSRRVSCFKYGN